MNKDRTDIAMLIAEELLESDTLDLNNFGYDVDSLLSFVQEIILNHLKDYLIISGAMLPDGAEIYIKYSIGQRIKKRTIKHNQKMRYCKMKKIYETGSVSTLYEMKSFFTMVRELFPVIDAFISLHEHELINEKICCNKCYSIKFGAKKTVLYLKQS